MTIMCLLSSVIMIMSESLSRAGSVRSFNTAYGGAQSRPQSPGGYSSGYEVSQVTTSDI